MQKRKRLRPPAHQWTSAGFTPEKIREMLKSEEVTNPALVVKRPKVKTSNIVGKALQERLNSYE